MPLIPKSSYPGPPFYQFNGHLQSIFPSLNRKATVQYQRERLTLADGTLAGADLSLLQAVRYMHETVGEPLERPLARATVIPAGMLPKRPELDQATAMIWIKDDLAALHWLTEL